MEFLENEYIAGALMVVFCLLVTELFKQPIKIATRKIANEKIRLCVNTVILIIPFLCAFGLYYVWCKYFMEIDFDFTKCAGYGASAISLYEVIVRVIGLKDQSVYNTQAGENAMNIVRAIAEEVADKSPDEPTATAEVEKEEEKIAEKSAVDTFYDEVK